MNRISACYSLAFAAGAVCVGLLAMSPSTLALDAVGDLNWCPGSRDCLMWSPSAGATQYNLYRGGYAQLPAVLDGTTDSCTVGNYATTSTGTLTDGEPLAGALLWYLVGAVDNLGAETTGQATAGPRDINSAGDCQAAATIVLSEVDYDQSGSDSAEFVEIHNPGPAAVDLTDIVLILVNGSTQAEYERVALSEAAASLAPGGFLVVGAAIVQPMLPSGTPFVAFGSSTNNMQNGAPDGIALFDAAAGTLLDALSYEGSIVAATFDDVGGVWNLVEGKATPLADSNTTTGSLGRLPSGHDTNNAAEDWFFLLVPTPGSLNALP